MELEEAIKRLKFHKTYAGLQNNTCIVNVKDLETVLQELERIRSLDMYKLVEDAETGQLIHKDVIREKIEKLNLEAKQHKNEEILTIIGREKLILTELL